MEFLTDVSMSTVQCSRCYRLAIPMSQAIQTQAHFDGHFSGYVYHCRPCAEVSCKQCIAHPQQAVPEEDHFARAHHQWVPLVPRLVEELPCCSQCGAWGKDLIRRPDGQCDHCARLQELPPPDVFAHTYPRTLEAVFKTLRPRTTTPTFDLLRSLYAADPTRVRIISGIHQNNAEDRLHLSLVVACSPASYTLHVYGYWKNYFRVTDITIKGTHILTIAEF